jgi:hypothetical protein
VAGTAAAAVVATVVALAGHDTDAPRAHAAPAPTVAPSSPPSSPSPTPPAPRLDAVAAGTPTAFVMAGPKFRIVAHVCSMPYVRPLDPHEVLNPMSELAMRQVDLAHPRHENGVPIYPVTDLNGYTIGLRTRSGRLTYRVTRAFAVSKERAADVRSVMNEHTPDRVVLITCGVRDGVDVDVNVIAYATLVRAVTNSA